MYLTRTDNVVKRFVADLDVDVPARSEGAWTSAIELKLAPSDFVAGPYVLRARAVVLESPHRAKGWEERDAYKFWLAEDPPQGGVFDDIQAVAFSPDHVRIDAEALRVANGWIFQYNILHPAYLRLAGSEDELAEYLFELMVRELVYVDLSSGDPVLFEESDLRDNRQQQRRAAQVVSGVLFDYYQGP